MAAPRLPIKAILIDLSGTIHIEDTAIPGAIDALKRLRKANVPLKFVTNTTKESRRFLYERLTGIGFAIQPEEIWTCLWAARDLVASRKLKPFLLIDDAAMEDFQGIVEENGSGKYDSVVVGLAPEKSNYEELNKAFRVLLTGAPLIAIHESRYYKRPDGLALGPGPFVKALEFAAECESEVVGKPNPAFFKSALGEIDPKSAIMIGDDIRIDIKGAMELGMRGFLVKTGKYRPGDENKISPGPSVVCEDFSEAVDIILKEVEEQ